MKKLGVDFSKYSFPKMLLSIDFFVFLFLCNFLLSLAWLLNDLPAVAGTNWMSKSKEILSLNIPSDNYYPPGSAILSIPFRNFTDVSLMFRSDLIKRPVYYKYDLSLSASKIYSNFKSWGNILPRDYDPTIYSTCFEHYPYKVVYSLQQQSGLKRDNWRNFLQFNYRDFEGKISTIKSLNAAKK
jgi:hypothetical protein